MLEKVLLNGYISIFHDIINEYEKIVKKNNGYHNYLKIIGYEIKTIVSAFEKLISEKKNTFNSIFKDDFESILHAIDKDLFEHIKSIFENVSILLNTK